MWGSQKTIYQLKVSGHFSGNSHGSPPQCLLKTMSKPIPNSDLSISEIQLAQTVSTAKHFIRQESE